MSKSRQVLDEFVREGSLSELSSDLINVIADAKLNPKTQYCVFTDDPTERKELRQHLYALIPTVMPYDIRVIGEEHIDDVECTAIFLANLSVIMIGPEPETFVKNGMKFVRSPFPQAPGEAS